MTDINKRVMVTGGAGFIGSSFVQYLLSKNFEVLNYDILSYAANHNRLDKFGPYNNHNFIKGDIRDRKQLDSLLSSFKPNFIVNFAAETHVDRSIENPKIFSDVNFMGTLNLLESVRTYTKKFGAANKLRFLQISTDEVYGTRDIDNPADEFSYLSPSNVYAASKASADLLVMSYFKTYNLQVIITRCCNNYGEGQYKEKFIPKVLNCLIERREIPLFGSGQQVRQWIHVEDHVRAVFDLMCHAPAGSIFNIGDDNFVKNLDLAEVLCEIYDEEAGILDRKSSNLIRHVDDRLGHDTCYSIASGKIKTLNGWSPRVDFRSGLRELVKFYLWDLISSNCEPL